MSLELLIFIGLQASGKTSFYRQRFIETHTHISKDNLPNNKNPQRRQLLLIEQAMLNGEPVVVDNTNPAVADRIPLLRLGKQFSAKTVGYYFQSQVEHCLERNSMREGQDRVPDVAIFSTTKKIELPSMDEGFDELFYVKISGSGGFQVAPWSSEGECP